MASMDSKWVQAKESAQRVLGFTNVKVDKDKDYPLQGHHPIIIPCTQVYLSATDQKLCKSGS